MTTTSKAVATPRQSRPANGREHPDQRGRNQLADQHQQEDRASRSARGTRRGAPAAWPPRRRSVEQGLSACHAPRRRTSEVSARASTPETASRTIDDGRSAGASTAGSRRWRVTPAPGSCGLVGGMQARGVVRPRTPRGAWRAACARAPPCARPRRSPCVVHAEQVQTGRGRPAGPSRLGAHARVRGVAQCHRGRSPQSEQQHTAGRRWSVGPVHQSPGPLSAFASSSSAGSCEHVGSGASQPQEQLVSARRWPTPSTKSRRPRRRPS